MYGPELGLDVPIVLSVWTRTKHAPLLIALPPAASGLPTDALCAALNGVGITVVGVRYEGASDRSGRRERPGAVVVIEAAGDPTYLFPSTDRIAACVNRLATTG